MPHQFNFRFFNFTIAVTILILALSACGPSSRPGDIDPVQQGPPPESAESQEPATPPEPPAQAEPTTESPAAGAPGSQPDSSAPVVVTFNITGGIVGFCDTLTVTEAGGYVLQSCQGEGISGTLAQADLEALQSWYHELAAFQLAFEDNPGGPDNLVSDLVFSGQGARQADEIQQQIIFDWANGLLIRVRPQPVAAPASPTPPVIGPEGLCPDINRPAMLVANYDNPSGLILIDPESQVTCDILLNQPPFGRIVTAVGNIYYPVFDPEAQTVSVWQLSPDGAQTPLDFTAVNMEQFGPFSFVLSADGSKIAWTRAVVDFGVDPPTYRNDLWVANFDGSGQVTLLEQDENTESRYIEPVRFSADNSTLYYALQPDGLGGSIFSFSGVFDSMYSVSVAGGQPELIYACPTAENPICIGDISPDGRVLVYAQPGEGVIQVISNDGSLVSSLTPPTADYLGQAIFGPTGTLAFVSAMLSQPASEDELPLPNPGYISLIDPPYTGRPRTLLTDNSVATLWEWVDETRLAYGSINESGDIGTTIVTTDGRTIELSPNFALAVLR